jgi:hypothetical protein
MDTTGHGFFWVLDVAAASQDGLYHHHHYSAKEKPPTPIWLGGQE